MITLQNKGNLISKIGVKRDLLRDKCKNIHFYVNRVIDVQAINQRLSRYYSPAKSLQLMPDGFEIDFGRKVLPAGEKE